MPRTSNIYAIAPRARLGRRPAVSFVRLATGAVAGLLAGLTLGAATVPGSAPAAAGAVSFLCGDRTRIVEQLRTQFNERQEQVVLRSETSLMELFVSGRGTWSILHTTPTGVSCVVAAGTGLPASAQT